ncbi:hypothetical protein UFOVP1004_47 [uncultured Caudovirales phage]|uniref:Uncharacterized protein n=1 Tax=uncultured Caudovirales phage TaxID=2100421 RepID=A0A6J5Q618_9CAUD|nr:hypothetical protein UFOVP1004_47 [uncultured Caudovirales phage]
MSSPHSTSTPPDLSTGILSALASIDEKIERVFRAARLEALPRSTIATALLLTGVTSRTEIAELLGVSRQWLGRGPEFEAFRTAEGYIKVTSAVSRRTKSGDDFLDSDD